VGPHTFNFDEVTRRLRDAGALLQVRDESELATAILSLLEDAPRRQGMGEAARRQVSELSGALARTLVLVDDVLEGRRA